MHVLLVVLALAGSGQGAPLQDARAGLQPPVPTGRIVPASVLPSSLPFEIRDGMLIVKASIGGAPDGEAALDTALSVSAMTIAAAEKTKVSPGADVRILGPHGPLKCQTCPPQALRLGRIVLEQVPFCVADILGQLSGGQVPTPPQYWLGASALAGLAITFDPVDQQIVVSRPETPLPKGITVPLDFAGGRPFVEVKINGKASCRAVLSTCTVGVLLPVSMAKLLGVVPQQARTVVLPSGKEGKVAPAIAKEVAVGGAKVRDLPVLCLLDDVAGPAEDHAIIGTRFLMRFRTTINYPRRKAVFQTPPDPTAAGASGAQPRRPRPDILNPRARPQQ